MKTIKDLQKVYGIKLVSRVKIEKLKGSDSMSYFITVDKKKVVDGLNLAQAGYYRETMIKQLFEKNIKKLLTKF